jgi:hypothetical protein
MGVAPSILLKCKRSEREREVPLFYSASSDRFSGSLPVNSSRKNNRSAFGALQSPATKTDTSTFGSSSQSIYVVLRAHVFSPTKADQQIPTLIHYFVMLRPLFLGSILLVLVVVKAQAQPQSPRASAPEDRAKAVEIARSLESDPLGKQAKDQRTWLMLWLTGVQDINVKACSGLLGPVVGSKKNYESELFTQTLASAAAFIITNPDKAKDDVAVYTAGLEGSLRTYESILKVKPKVKWPFLDDLLDKRNKGELAEHVRQSAAHCK